MRKVLLVLFCVFLYSVISADDFKLDVTMAKTLYANVETDDIVNADVMLPFCPIVDVHYFFFDRDQMFNVGLGIRAIPAILLNALVPDIAIDGVFGNLTVRIQSAGGLYFLHSLGTILVGFAPYLAPEINLFYSINDWVALGGGYIVCFDARPDAPFISLPNAFYFGAKFIL